MGNLGLEMQCAGLGISVWGEDGCWGGFGVWGWDNEVVSGNLAFDMRRLVWGYWLGNLKMVVGDSGLGMSNMGLGSVLGIVRSFWDM